MFLGWQYSGNCFHYDRLKKKMSKYRMVLLISKNMIEIVLLLGGGIPREARHCGMKPVLPTQLLVALEKALL